MYLDSSFPGIYSIPSELGEIVSRKKWVYDCYIVLLNVPDFDQPLNYWCSIILFDLFVLYHDQIL